MLFILLFSILMFPFSVIVANNIKHFDSSFIIHMHLILVFIEMLHQICRSLVHIFKQITTVYV